MKYTFTFVFLLAFSLLHSQYLPTVVEGNFWEVEQPQGMGSVINYSYILLCDTVIDNKTYLQIIDDQQKVRGFVREDTAAQKVYAIQVGEQEESLIIDYTLMPGDTFDANGFPLVCDSVYQRDIFGANRKFIQFQFEAFIEGVGYSFNGVLGFGTFSYLTGFDETGTTCSTSVPEEAERERPDFFPNPFDSQLTIVNPPGRIHLVRLYDVQGKMVLEEWTSFVETIATHHLAPGMYILEYDGKHRYRVVKH